MPSRNSFFDETHNYTEHAYIFEEELYDVVNQTLDKWLEKGYSPREISYLFQSYVNEVATEKILGLKFGMKMDSHVTKE